ncbi:MAG: tRNA epoxyqueuosine(34) reductase QueG [Bacteroidales bacterium]|nr:tRNA epoxyqueuosine(34) reductase QueG [Bacteroidales bacterium]
MHEKDNISHKRILTAEVRKLSVKLGFHSCGFARARHLPENEKSLREWLGKGMHAGMNYMANNIENRSDPRCLVEGAQSVIVLLHNYFPEKDLLSDDNYTLARYARGNDYHKVIKRKLKKIIEYLKEQDPAVTARGFTDSAPVFEKAWAAQTGLGWIGKNTLLITREQGSYFFIAEIITNQLFDYDVHREPDRCGDCNLCIEACPTGALNVRKLDARKCISYWTTEQREGGLPEDLREKSGNRIFGCDICQEVCPWNKKAKPTDEPDFWPNQEIAGMEREKWETLSEEDFKRIFHLSPLRRLSFCNLVRNVNFVRPNLKEGNRPSG